jgi:hypothetical protein
VPDRQHQLRRDQGAAAEIAARAYDGNDGTANAVSRRRAAADNGAGGSAHQQRRDRDYPRQDFHRRSISPRYANRQGLRSLANAMKALAALFK